MLLLVYFGLFIVDDSQVVELIGLFSGLMDFFIVVFGIEGGLFYQVGILVVICGFGSMDQGYKLDEFVSFVQFEVCDVLLVCLVVWLWEF